MHRDRLITRIMADDPFAQRLRLIEKITRLFKERGWDLVVLGGSAVTGE